jgi:hypothetical protein
MSGMRHATVSAWQRHEDGSYAAEINGWALRVKWHPEESGQRGFSWEAEHGGEKLRSTEIHEEIEVAMAEAEAQAEPAVAAEPAPHH